MRILQVQHWKPELEYSSAPFFARRGDSVRDLLLFAGEAAPAPSDFDAVIVYGGYMSAFDDAGNPWIAREMRFLESCLKAGKPVLGICLGSQLLARVLGARVYRCPAPEFGFKRIRLTEAGAADPALGPLGAGSADRGFSAMEWHSDAWDLPAGATLLATGERWANQAFRCGEGCLAIQFHLEFTREQIAAAMATSPGEAAPDPTAESLSAFAAPNPLYGEVRAAYELLLGSFLPTGEP